MMAFLYQRSLIIRLSRGSTLGALTNRKVPSRARRCILAASSGAPMTLKPKVKKYIRYAEATVIVVLLAVALLTYRELSNLRKYPVALPKYEFEIAGNAGDTVRTRGTW